MGTAVTLTTRSRSGKGPQLGIDDVRINWVAALGAGQVRVHRAAFLLREGMAVSMVAAATGFADQSHLTRLFKRLVGVPPGEYQRASLVASGRHTAARLRAGS